LLLLYCCDATAPADDADAATNLPVEVPAYAPKHRTMTAIPRLHDQANIEPARLAIFIV